MDLCWQSNVSAFQMLSRLVITFLPRSKRLLVSWLQLPSATISVFFFFFFYRRLFDLTKVAGCTSPKWENQHPDLNSVGLSLVNSNLQSQLGKGPGWCSHPMVETSNCSLGAPAYNPRPKSDVIISLHIKIQLWFSFYNAVCFTL